MAERLSALAHLAAARRRRRPRHAVGVPRRARSCRSQAWPDTLDARAARIAELLGVEAPESGSAVAATASTVAAVAPGRFLVAGDADDLAARFEAALPSSDGAVTDLSHGRAILRLEGEAAADVLCEAASRSTSIPRVFPPGRVAQTMIHHIDVLIHPADRRRAFELWVLRSFARVARGMACSMRGLEFGIGSARQLSTISRSSAASPFTGTCSRHAPFAARIGDERTRDNPPSTSG